jgi:hypothetical protein
MRVGPIKWDLATTPDDDRPVILLKPCQCHWFLAMVGKRKGAEGYYSGWAFVEVPAAPGRAKVTVEESAYDEDVVHPTREAAIAAARGAVEAIRRTVLADMMREGRHVPKN